jgi:hypothetical protein
MAVQVELVQGDMFEGPSDLVVLPCSTIPTVTPFVLAKLRHFRIPQPLEPMRLGEVVFLPLEGAAHVAPTAAFAASVKAGYGSEPEAINAIGSALGRFADQNRSVQQIACPLLGAGAGYLGASVVVEQLRRGFLATAPDRVTLKIFVLHAPEFAELQKSLASAADSPPPGGIEGHASRTRPIRVFISYTKTTDASQAWVTALATHLLENGIDARLDVWDLSPGMDVAQWMTNELDLADRVLLICDEAYARKADRRHGGVGWEIRIVQGDLLLSRDDNPKKYVPIVRTDEVMAGTPVFLRSTYSLHWPQSSADDSARRQELVKTIYGVRSKPPLGRPPSYVL